MTPTAMNLEVDPDLVEKVVFLALRDRAALQRRVHSLTDPLYAIPDRRRRDAAFREVTRRVFTELDFGRPIRTLLDERPLIARRVGQCFVREAPRRKAQCADLYVKEDLVSGTRATLFIDLTPEALLCPESFATWLRRDLLHVADMLDESFGYRKGDLEGHSPRCNLIRDRYRVLWDIYVAGRLSREGFQDPSRAEILKRQFHRAFGPEAAGRYLPEFLQLMDAPRLTHTELRRWAEYDDILLDMSPGPRGPRPGSLCPICGFSTFDWWPAGDLPPERVAAIRRDYPAWERSAGLCRQCGDIYAGRCAGGAQREGLVP